MPRRLIQAHGNENLTDHDAVRTYRAARRRPPGAWHEIDAAQGWAEYQHAHGGGGIGSNRPPGINHTDRMLDGLAVSFGLAIVFVLLFVWPPIFFVALLCLGVRGLFLALNWIGDTAHAAADRLEQAPLPRTEVEGVQW